MNKHTDRTNRNSWLTEQVQLQSNDRKRMSIRRQLEGMTATPNSLQCYKDHMTSLRQTKSMARGSKNTLI